MRSSLRSLAFALALVLTASAAAASPLAPREEFHYRWHLGRFLGAVAGLFLPSQGDGVLSFEPHADGLLTTELLITSEASKEGEFWRYGSQIDAVDGRALRAWSSYRWRGKNSEKEGKVTGKVVDIASGIYLLRRDPPREPRRMEIWSDGKVYPVEVVPVGMEMRKVRGKQVPLRHLSIRGVDVPGGRQWKGRVDLWLTLDEAATPVEIFIQRSLAGLRLELKE